MNFDSIPNGTKWYFSLSLALLFSTTAFSQFAEQNNHREFNYYSGSESSDTNSRTRPRIFADSIETPNDVAVPSISEKKPEPHTISTQELERQAFELLNRRRIENGLKPIVWNDDIAKIARLHSQNMATNNFFSHQGLDGLMVDDRADSAGIKNWKSVGENIAYNRGYDNPVEFAVLRWMQSQSHRENLLSGKWKESGIGIAVGADGKTYYFTQVFMLRK